MTRGVQLPLIESVRISHFSLYKNKVDNAVSFGPGVFCLVGANGLGKSTFLALVNFGVSGIVAAPDQKVMSIREYYKDSVRYSSEYFTGRVAERDRDLAEVAVDFSIGPHRYKVTRGLFSPQTLRGLSITGPDVNIDEHPPAEDENLCAELHDRYVEHVLEHTGLSGFDQLVFLQLFLLTFDERRHLLFWDTEVTLQVLYFVFGLNPEHADQAGELLRRADRFESQARNAQYQATTARERRAELLAQIATPFQPDRSLEDEYDALQEAKDDLEERVDEKAAEERDARLAVSVAVSKQHDLTIEYDRVFTKRLDGQPLPLTKSPIIIHLLNSAECSLCGAADVPQSTLDAVSHSTVCPLCRTEVKSDESEKGGQSSFEELEGLDRALKAAVLKVDETQHTSARVTDEVRSLTAQYLKAVDNISGFEERNSGYFAERKLARASAGATAVAAQLEAEARDATSRRDDFRRKRDECKELLIPLQRELAEKYALAEREFVPSFRALAHAFLGLDLDLTLEQRARGPRLFVSINGQERRKAEQLSESQRYFIDIALRMALAEYLVGDDSPACLFIDTPEGSLDIAYERRAGEMFGEFVRRGNKLVMTANLNSSRLVLELARQCRRELMHLERMTGWSVLSEVQADAEDLFEESFRAIQKQLDSKV